MNIFLQKFFTIRNFFLYLQKKEKNMKLYCINMASNDPVVLQHMVNMARPINISKKKLNSLEKIESDGIVRYVDNENNLCYAESKEIFLTLLKKYCELCAQIFENNIQ